MIGVIIVLLIVAYVAYKFLGNNDNDYVKQRIKGRNENQKKVIRYFCNDDGILTPTKTWWEHSICHVLCTPTSVPC